MVIKTIPWHHSGFSRLTNYIDKGREKESELDIEIRHNLRHGRDLRTIVQALKDNDAYRRDRVNGIHLYHEVLSFHGHDRDSLTPEIIEDLVTTYLEMRAPDALAYGAVHQDQAHVHVHLLLSGNDFRSTKATRLDRARFEGVRRELEQYQISRYPEELKHSIAHTARRQTRKRRREQKEQVRDEVQRCLDRSDTLEALHDHLRAAGLEPYEYRGRLNGVILEDRKFRFNSLDVDLARIQEMDERNRKPRREDVEQTRIAELEEIQKSKTGRHLEHEQTPEEAHLDDIPDPDAEAAALEMEAEAEALRQEAELDAAHAEAEALHWQAEMEAQGERQAEEAQRAAEIEATEQEAIRIQELEAIQAEAHRREQERGLERE